MQRCCLYMNDTALLDKMEYFIYEYSGIEYNKLEIVLNHFLGNKTDWARINDTDNRYRLREMLSYYNSEECIEEKNLENAIELFLLFLRTYDIEASVSLEALLDEIWKTGKVGREWNCVKRVNGILASVYLLYYRSRAKVFDKEKTETYMKDIFEENIKFYSVEDKKFLTQLFMMEKRYDCLIALLRSKLKYLDVTEKYGIESERDMAREFFKILYKLENIGEYQDAIVFYNESEFLFRRADKDIKRDWEKSKASILFGLGRYEEAKAIQDKYINEFDDSKNISDLYNGAIYYAWAANYKEKDDPAWKDYIEKAYDLIIQAEEFISHSDDSLKADYQASLNRVILEKAFLLSEKENYEEAFRCFEEAFANADKQTKKESNFGTHMWILMNYMCLNPDQHSIVIDWIERLYSEFSHTRLREYEEIIDFVHSNEYLKENPGLYSIIYEDLLKLLFYALKIRHASKVRDISQYNIFYYTKAEHLRLLLEDEVTENCKYRFPMFHVCHMNDPQEGRIINYLLGREKSSGMDTFGVTHSRKQYEESYVFLKSFFCSHKDNSRSGAKENLPMWVQYGDDAKGCCVVLNSKTFEHSDLRRIIYLSDNGECDNKEINSSLKNFLITYRKLVDLCEEQIDSESDSGKECLIEMEFLIAYIVSQIAYLFKHESYKQENEVRLIVNRTSDEIDDIKVISGSVPKTYIYNGRQSYIDEIILGVKMKNPEDYVPFIYKQGRKMWENSKESQIKVTQSTLQYR